MWNGQRRHAGQRELVTLWRFPNSGCGELDHVTVRVAEIQTARAAFPTYLAQKIDIMFGQARSPEIECVFANSECDVSRSAAVMLGKSDGWQDIATRCSIRRLRCLATDDEQIALIACAEHTACIARFHFAQT